VLAASLPVVVCELGEAEDLAHQRFTAGGIGDERADALEPSIERICACPLSLKKKNGLARRRS